MRLSLDPDPGQPAARPRLVSALRSSGRRLSLRTGGIVACRISSMIRTSCQTVRALLQGRGRACTVPGWLPSLLVGLVVLIVYLSTLAPTITWEHHGTDGGDLIAASQVLGVPHPPGYPLYVVVGHLLSRLPLPGGNLALRFNLLSAFSAAAASALLSATVRRMATPLAGVVSGLVLGFGTIFWSQAIIAEVYALNSLLVAGLFMTVLTPQAQRVPRFRTGLLWGLSWTTHLTSALLFPLVLWRMGAKVYRCLAGWLIGLSPFLLLPLFAVRRPVINWGDPVTLKRWWWLISGELYGGYLFGLPPEQWPGRVTALVHFSAQSLTWPGLLLALFGMVQLARRDRSLCIALVVSTVIITFYALGYNTSDSQVLLIPVSMMAAVFLGLGVAAIGPVVRSPWRPIRWACLAIPVYLLFAGWARVDLHDDREAADFGETVMAEAPVNALVYTATDAHTFTLWYYRHAEGWRPDLTVVDQDMLAEEWYQTMLRAQDPDWSTDPGGRPFCTVAAAGELNCYD